MYAMRWYSSIHMSVNIHGLSDSCIFLFFQSCPSNISPSVVVRCFSILYCCSYFCTVFHRAQLFTAMHKLVLVYDKLENNNKNNNREKN